VKWLKATKLEDLEDMLGIWIGQVNMKNGAATDEVIKEQVEVPEQQISVTHFVYKFSILLLKMRSQ
jgi:hypothetical protein